MINLNQLEPGLVRHSGPGFVHHLKRRRLPRTLMKIHYCLFVCFCVQSNRKRDQIDCICFAPFVTKRLVSNSTAPYYISLLSDAQYRNPNLDLGVQIPIDNR